MNPILAREIRARFRDKRSYLLLLGLTVLLCLAAGWIYQEASYRAELQARYAANMGGTYGYNPYGNSYASPQDRSRQTGRDLFKALAFGNVLVWMLVAPALTATGLCKERERGLLESLWLTPFRVRDQIFGRFAASLLFLFELQLVALPVYGIAVMLGGVSPGEILLTGAIIGITAFGGAALGLWCSSRSYRPSGAMGSALGILILTTLIVFFGLQLFGSLFFYLQWDWLFTAVGYLSLLHPWYLSIIAIQGNNPNNAIGPLPEGIIPATLFCQFLISLLLLWGATRNAAKPLPDAAWLGRNPYFERWRSGLEKRKIERQERDEKAKVGEKVGGALLYEVPFEKLARFRDPVLRREVRARFRLRQSGIGIALLRLAALFLVVSTWLFMVATLFEPRSRSGVAQALVFLLAGLGVLAVGILSSSSFTGERESGTWEGLKLSLLSTRHIVTSKWASPLVTFAYWSFPLWMWLPFCVRFSSHSGMAFSSMLAVTLVVIVALGAATAWGLYVSSRSPHSAAATSWTLATLFLFLVGMPVLDGMLNVKPRITNLIYGTPYGRYTYGSSYYYGGIQNSEEDFQVAQSRWRFEHLLDSYHPFISIDTLLDANAEDTSSFNSFNSFSSFSSYRPFYPDAALKWEILFLNLSGTAGLTWFLLTLVKRRAEKIETL